MSFGRVLEQARFDDCGGTRLLAGLVRAQDREQGLLQEIPNMDEMEITNVVQTICKRKKYNFISYNF